MDASATTGQGGEQTAEMAVECYKPLIPDGVYEAKFLWHETANVFGTPKVFLHFEIVQAGPYFGLRLFRAFRVRKLVGRPGKGSKFAAHAGGDLFAVMTTLLDLKLRQDRISFAALTQMLFRVSTRTVTHNQRQRAIPEAARYSVVDRIERGE